MIEPDELPVLSLEPRWKDSDPDEELLGYSVMNGNQAVGTLTTGDLMHALGKWGLPDDY